MKNTDTSDSEEEGEIPKKKPKNQVKVLKVSKKGIKKDKRYQDFEAKQT